MEQDNKQGQLSSIKPLRRVLFEEGKPLLHTDLSDAQNFIIEKLRRHNQIFHPSGVISGLKVTIKNGDAQKVIMTAGVAVDNLGNEIVVPEDMELDIPSSLKGEFSLGLAYQENIIDARQDLPEQIQEMAESFQYQRIEDSYVVRFFEGPLAPEYVNLGPIG